MRAGSIIGALHTAGYGGIAGEADPCGEGVAVLAEGAVGGGEADEAAGEGAAGGAEGVVEVGAGLAGEADCGGQAVAAGGESLQTARTIAPSQQVPSLASRAGSTRTLIAPIEPRRAQQTTTARQVVPALTHHAGSRIQTAETAQSSRPATVALPSVEVVQGGAGDALGWVGLYADGAGGAWAGEAVVARFVVASLAGEAS